MILPKDTVFISVTLDATRHILVQNCCVTTEPMHVTYKAGNGTDVVDIRTVRYLDTQLEAFKLRFSAFRHYEKDYFMTFVLGDAFLYVPIKIFDNVFAITYTEEFHIKRKKGII